ncbi:MAG: MlaE family lipid ABC transporter permease subunit [Kofleriaceae bacterium]|nr:MlaE family lipid ABC transporter permease subunit [Kofleriaceae bacterium]
MSSWRIARDGPRIVVEGELRIDDGPGIWRELTAAAARPEARLDLDITGATVIDAAMMALLVELRAMLIRRGVECALVGASAGLQSVVHLLHGDEVPPRATVEPSPGFVRRLGAATARLGSSIRTGVMFLGELVASVAGIVRHPARMDQRGLPSLVVRAGLEGLPIVLLLNFLVGFVMAFQSMAYLKLYGASPFVADIVGISVTRELGPLMTAVIITGRSGAAYAAELGTMRVNEEIDALQVMGIRPVSYLVVPRIVALILIAPALTLLADLVGLGGGLLVGVRSLGLTPHGYLSELRSVLVASDVWTGLVKSAVFGAAIATIGCRNGLATSGSASEVGRSTTATVVQSLFAIVLLDTLLTVLFRGYSL